MAAISLTGLTKRYGSVEAVRDVSLEVAEGEFFGLLGPNGAGKTTTLSILATLLPPTAGRAFLAGHDVVREQAAVRRSLGMVFQDRSLDDYLTAEENLRFSGMLYGVGSRELARRSAELLQLLELWEHRRRLVRTFSGGMKRRLEIARGLLHRPQVLFLDEPTLGLDPQTRALIWSYLEKVRRKEGITVLMTTHYMEEAEACDRVAIIDHGRIVALDTPERLKRTMGGDVVVVHTAEPAAARDFLAEQGIAARVEDGQLYCEVPDGEAFIPLLFRQGFPIQAVGIRRPTLEDVFLKLTGHAIREEELEGRDIFRERMRVHRGR